MMNQQPDELFRRALENHTKPSPERAWSRIEENLSGKPGFVWLKIAATLLVVAATAGLLGLLLFEEDPASPVAVGENTISMPSDPSETSERSPDSNNAIAENTPDENDNTEVTSINPKAGLQQRKAKVDRPEDERRQRLAGDNIVKERTEDQQSAGIPVEQEQALTALPFIPEPEPERDDYKLVVTASEVNAKYLIKKNIAQATDSVKRSSGIKRLLDKAQDLKTNQDALADLRQMKNEILAFNFQKQDQNK